MTGEATAREEEEEEGEGEQEGEALGACVCERGAESEVCKKDESNWLLFRKRRCLKGKEKERDLVRSGLISHSRGEESRREKRAEREKSARRPCVLRERGRERERERN